MWSKLVEDVKASSVQYSFLNHLVGDCSALRVGRQIKQSVRVNGGVPITDSPEVTFVMTMIDRVKANLRSSAVSLLDGTRKDLAYDCNK